ncbi:MAG: integrin alpha [Myxococcota bacterium]
MRRFGMAIPVWGLWLLCGSACEATREAPLQVDDDGAAARRQIQSLLSNPVWTAESNRVGASFGNSVASAGDVNGDGFADVLVGAFTYSNGQALEGQVSLYLGSASGLSSSAAWSVESNQDSATLGRSVASAGDVNGDGFSDVLVGADGYGNTESSEGQVQLYLGSASGLGSTPAWTIESNQADAELGVSVASAGDVNGDGYADVIVGARNFDNGESNEGRAFLYLGSSSGLASTPVWTAESNQVNGNFGRSVASAGDVNGDGLGDVVVGASYYSNPETWEGRAYLYFGSASGLTTTPAWTAESNQANAAFGWSVASAGDVNGDGFADVIVGADSYTNGQSAEGRAYLYLGSPTGLGAAPAWTFESDNTSAGFGRSVASAGDVNGDGFADVVVGADYFTNIQMGEGRIYLFLGSENGLSSSISWSVESYQAAARLGSSVASAGDVNGDGLGDVIAGAYLFDNGQVDEGRAFVYLGTTRGLTGSAIWTAESNQSTAHFGFSVGGAGDVDGDGFADVVVGAPEAANGQLDEGRAFVYRGAAGGLAPTSSWIGEADQGNARFGGAVASAGDVNGDGHADVIIGASQFDNGEAGEGAAFVYLGSATGLGSTFAWMAEGNQANAQFGHSVAAAGDVNGDGLGDVIIGAREYDNGEPDEGRAFVYLGSPAGLGANPAWTAEVNQAVARFGVSVASAGDINGDGFCDVIVGAPFWDNGESAEGRALLYLGSPAGLGTAPAWSYEPDRPGAELGWSVASAGDVNGDGFADVIVGAHLYSSSGTDSGAAFVFLGSASGLSASPDWSVLSMQPSARMGESVASAGDVNGDGFADVVVGVAQFTGNVTFEGQVLVFLGSVTGLGGAIGWGSDESDQADARLGYSVTSAGDVNGDGFGDVLAGAFMFDNGEADEGRAYLYLGGDRAPGLSRGLKQFQADGVTRLGLGTTAPSSSVVLAGRVTQENGVGGGLQLEVETKRLGVAFDGLGTVRSSRIPVGGSATVALTALADGAYRWRARVVYPVGSGRGRWVSFGGNSEGEADFRIGTFDAGSSADGGGPTLDAGAASDAGVLADGGVANGAGAARSGPLHLRVGCGCGGGAGTAWWLGGVWVAGYLRARRRR